MEFHQRSMAFTYILSWASMEMPWRWRVPGPAPIAMASHEKIMALPCRVSYGGAMGGTARDQGGSWGGKKIDAKY